MVIRYFFIILILVTTIVTKVTSTRVNLNEPQMLYGTDFFLFPSQDGSGGVVPAIITEPEFIRTKTVNPDDIHFYLYTLQ